MSKMRNEIYCVRMLIGEKTHLGILREKEARAWRRSDFGLISSHSLLLNDQASWVKEIQKDFKVRNKP